MDDFLELAKKIDKCSTVKTYDKAGKGKKQCAKCDVIVGVRTIDCPKCGGRFVSKKPAVVSSSKNYVSTADVDPEIILTKKFYSGIGFYPSKKTKYLLIPSDDCPVKLKKQPVIEWVDNLIELKWAVSTMVTPGAMKFYLRQFVKFNSEEYHKLCGEIDTIIEDNLHD